MVERMYCNFEHTERMIYRKKNRSTNFSLLYDYYYENYMSPEWMLERVLPDDQMIAWYRLFTALAPVGRQSGCYLQMDV